MRLSGITFMAAALGFAERVSLDRKIQRVARLTQNKQKKKQPNLYDLSVRYRNYGIGRTFTRAHWKRYWNKEDTCDCYWLVTRVVSRSRSPTMTSGKAWGLLVWKGKLYHNGEERRIKAGQKRDWREVSGPAIQEAHKYMPTSTPVHTEDHDYTRLVEIFPRLPKIDTKTEEVITKKYKFRGGHKKPLVKEERIPLTKYLYPEEYIDPDLLVAENVFMEDIVDHIAPGTIATIEAEIEKEGKNPMQELDMGEAPPPMSSAGINSYLIANNLMRMDVNEMKAYLREIEKAEGTQGTIDFLEELIQKGEAGYLDFFDPERTDEEAMEGLLWRKLDYEPELKGQLSKLIAGASAEVGLRLEGQDFMNPAVEEKARAEWTEKMNVLKSKDERFWQDLRDKQQPRPVPPTPTEQKFPDISDEELAELKLTRQEYEDIASGKEPEWSSMPNKSIPQETLSINDKVGGVDLPGFTQHIETMPKIPTDFMDPFDELYRTTTANHRMAKEVQEKHEEELVELARTLKDEENRRKARGEGTEDLDYYRELLDMEVAAKDTKWELPMNNDLVDVATINLLAVTSMISRLHCWGKSENRGDLLSICSLVNEVEASISTRGHSNLSEDDVEAITSLIQEGEHENADFLKQHFNPKQMTERASTISYILAHIASRQAQHPGPMRDDDWYITKSYYLAEDGDPIPDELRVAFEARLARGAQKFSDRVKRAKQYPAPDAPTFSDISLNDPDSK